MSNTLHTTTNQSSHLDDRIFAVFDARVSWKNQNTKKMVATDGETVNLGSNAVLISLDYLPPVGAKVSLTISDGNTELISVPALVIRLVRDPAKPKAALQIEGSLKTWKEEVLPAAQRWVNEDIALNYTEDNWLN